MIITLINVRFCWKNISGNAKQIISHSISMNERMKKKKKNSLISTNIIVREEA